MKTLNALKNEAEVSIADIAEYLNISYVDAAKIFHEEKKCTAEQKKEIKIFLIKNYTECIDNVLNQL